VSARALPFLIFPLAVIAFAILLNSATGPNINGSACASFQNSGASGQQCNSASLGTSYYCQVNFITPLYPACMILPACTVPPYPSPAFCIGDPFSALQAGCLPGWTLAAITNGGNGQSGCGVFLPAGSFVFIGTQQIAASISSSGAFFPFAVAGASGFITMIGLVVGIVSLAGITIMGSGENAEGIHILFMGGMVLGFWLILSGTEGFVGGNKSELFFNSMNGAIPGVGTFIFVILTLSVVIGFTGLVSRGS